MNTSTLSFSIGSNDPCAFTVPTWGFPSSAKTVPVVRSRELSPAIVSCLEQKRLAGLRPRYIKSLAQYLARFAGHIGNGDVRNINIEQVEQFLSTHNGNPSTRASNIGRLASLFSFCKRRGWIAESPVANIEKVRFERKTPFIFAPEQCRGLFEWTRKQKPRYIPYLALALFAGIRPEEIGKLTWNKVDLVDGTVRVDAAASKTRRRRMVHLSANALAWLKVGGDLPIHKTARRRWEHRAKAILGLSSWPQDSLRHTAASMMMARDANASVVATELGNSPGILATHYIDLVKKEDADRFWQIEPTA